MAVTGRNCQGGTNVLIIRQPDGTLAHIPAWMMHEEASLHHIGEVARLPLDRLRNVRLEIDGLLSFLSADSDLEGGRDEAREARPTADLFETKDPPLPLPSDRREKVLQLVQALLLETMMVGTASVVEEGHD